MSTISRRSVTQGLAWTVPSIAAVVAAPMAAASCAPGQTATVLNRFTYRTDSFTQSGADGALNTVAFWVTVTENPKPAALPACVTWVDNTGLPAEIKIVNQRVSGSTGTRVRSISLTQANPNFTSVDKTLDPAGRSHPLGSSDYEWTIRFIPSQVFNGLADQRFYVTLSNGDGGVVGGRIINNLIVDGVVADPSF